MDDAALRLFVAFCGRVADPLLLLTTEGVVQAANRPAASLFGRARDDLVGKSLAALLAPPLSGLERYLEDSARTTGPLPARLRLPRADGGVREVRCEAGLLGSDASDALLLRLREVGDKDPFVLLGQQIQTLTAEVLRRKAAEEEQRAHAEEAKRARALAEEALRVREEFLSIASHELRNPLSALKLHLVGLERGASKRPQTVTPAWVEERAGKSLAQVARMERLVEELLDVTRLTAGRLTLERAPVELCALSRDVVEQQRALAGEQQHIELVAPDPVVVLCDAMRMEQVIGNLLSNAVKYGRGEPVRVVVAREGDYATILVQDGGIGIAREDCARVFDRFERAVSPRHHGGFGLGLWIARQIVEAHGGQIEVESVLDAGSTFRVTVPLASEEGGA